MRDGSAANADAHLDAEHDAWCQLGLVQMGLDAQCALDAAPQQTLESVVLVLLPEDEHGVSSEFEHVSA